MTEFERIYNEYFRGVYTFVLSLSRNEKIAEEITQETFFKALKGIDKFKGNCKINVRLCKKAKKYIFHLSRQAETVWNRRYIKIVSESSIERKYLNNEETFRIHKAIHFLDEPYKEVFMLRVFGELSYNQISQLFEKTESWGRVTFYRAKQKIQDLLKEE